MTSASGGEGLVCFAKGYGEVSLSVSANCKLPLHQCLSEAQVLGLGEGEM